MIELVLGGARSGKSSYAQRRAIDISQSQSYSVQYVATATAIDAEMQARIARHQAMRPNDWQLVEVPLLLAEHIQAQSDHQSQVMLIDCLTLWLNNQLYADPEQNFADLFAALLQALNSSDQHIILVANEVGLGVIPLGQVSRQFVDQAGWLNQAIAKIADKVTFIAAGLPMHMKGAEL